MSVQQQPHPPLSAACATAAHRPPRAMPGWALALPVALLTLIPLLAVTGVALTPQPETWDHLLRHVLPRVTANTALLMLLVGIGVVVVGVPLA